MCRHVTRPVYIHEKNFVFSLDADRNTPVKEDNQLASQQVRHVARLTTTPLSLSDITNVAMAQIQDNQSPLLPVFVTSLA